MCRKKVTLKNIDSACSSLPKNIFDRGNVPGLSFSFFRISIEFQIDTDRAKRIHTACTEPQTFLLVRLSPQPKLSKGKRTSKEPDRLFFRESISQAMAEEVDLIPISHKKKHNSVEHVVFAKLVFVCCCCVSFAA